MKYTYGTIIAVASALFFYLRLIILQRQKVKPTALAPKNMSKKNRQVANQGKDSAANRSLPRMEIVSPFVLGVGIVLILFGAVLSIAPWFNPQAREWWWLPVSAGIVLMSFSMR